MGDNKKFFFAMLDPVPIYCEFLNDQGQEKLSALKKEYMDLTSLLFGQDKTDEDLTRLKSFDYPKLLNMQHELSELQQKSMLAYAFHIKENGTPQRIKKDTIEILQDLNFGEFLCYVYWDATQEDERPETIDFFERSDEEKRNATERILRRVVSLQELLWEQCHDQDKNKTDKLQEWERFIGTIISNKMQTWESEISQEWDRDGNNELDPDTAADLLADFLGETLKPITIERLSTQLSHFVFSNSAVDNKLRELSGGIISDLRTDGQWTYISIGGGDFLKVCLTNGIDGKTDQELTAWDRSLDDAIRTVLKGTSSSMMTFTDIFQVFAGGDPTLDLHPSMEKEMLETLIKFSRIWLEIDFSDVNPNRFNADKLSELGFSPKGIKQPIATFNIIPGKRHGKDVTIINFKSYPLIAFDELEDNFTSVPIELLRVPRLKDPGDKGKAKKTKYLPNTKRNIVIKLYLLKAINLRRKGGRNSNTILWETLVKQCDLSKDRGQKQSILEDIKCMLTYWTNKELTNEKGEKYKLLQDFHFVYEKVHGKDSVVAIFIDVFTKEEHKIIDRAKKKKSLQDFAKKRIKRT